MSWKHDSRTEKWNRIKLFAMFKKCRCFRFPLKTNFLRDSDDFINQRELTRTEKQSNDRRIQIWTVINVYFFTYNITHKSISRTNTKPVIDTNTYVIIYWQTLSNTYIYICQLDYTVNNCCVQSRSNIYICTYIDECLA